ncbi:OLC1v1024030C2 [Oldenlandia corymbosa var. corymbosa]|uniref:OLC1v1024030C2 n=1 Tax=Oldenlandia corymbosa var. corymbosa TaxID=529605 RepID=A0AAV1C1K2_OLDCO|nr:OLC1v1024030C2 [Oldenlandia corymbosa var. corymbosa]
MLDILFGWRKASKCKRRIRRLQRRLKLLKNKRSTIVRQLRDDVAQLLKHGHGQTAFDRVEHLFKDECLLAVYDLLEKFCEFIISNLHYIRRNKDCPNDINEAVSSLIFASARFGDLPELISIRKLFADRYGQRFATVALELLPGNLVNRQMREKMCIKSVTNDEKSKLLEEILKSSLQSGPLLLEYNSSELQQKSQENESRIEPVPSSETIDVIPNDGDNEEFSNIQDEKALVCLSLPISSSTFPSTTADKGNLDTMVLSAHQKHERLITSAQEISSCAVEVSDVEQLERSLVVYDPDLRRKEKINSVVDSSSEASARLPEEIVYLDDIQEFESPLSKESNQQDQRLFKFRSSAVLISGKTDISVNKTATRDQGKEDLQDQKSVSRSIRKNRRFRRRSISGEATSITDIECEIYYGESYDSSPNYTPEHHDQTRQKHFRKIPNKKQARSYYVEEIQNDDTIQGCSLDHPCYSCTYNEKQEWNNAPQKSTHLQLIGHTSREEKPPFLEEESGMIPNQKMKKSEDAKSPTLLISTCSGGSSSSSSTSIEDKPSYIRAMTLPAERSNKDATVLEGVIRSNSFPFREHDHQLSSHNRIALTAG